MAASSADIRAVNEEICELIGELDRLWGEPLVDDVPSILKLIEMEVTRLSEIKQSMAANDVHMDENLRKMIDRVSVEFDLQDASSVDLLRKRLMDELGVLNLNFRPPLLRITSLIPVVVDRLGEKIIRELTAAGNGGNIGEIIAIAINIATRDNPQDVDVDEVIELLRRNAPNINVDDADVKKLIFQKCNEAKDSGDEKLDKGGSSTKQDD